MESITYCIATVFPGEIFDKAIFLWIKQFPEKDSLDV